MERTIPFGEVLDVVEQLSTEEQETLVDILQHRIVEQGRKTLVAEIEASRREFAEGKCKPVTVDEIMKEILS